MKQRITINQLKEISEEEQRVLNKWWEPAEGDFAVDLKQSEIILLNKKNSADVALLKENYLPLLSIGQLIEILLYYDKKVGNSLQNALKLLHRLMPRRKEPDGICDALWETVKSLLDKEVA